MKRILLVILLVVVIWVLADMVKSNVVVFINDASLIMSGIDGEKVREEILTHFNTSIVKDGAIVDDNVDVDITTAYINVDTKKDILAKVVSDATCGTGGCITAIFIQNESNEFVAIPFAFAVKEIAVESSITNQMHDLKINNDGANLMKWDGQRYSQNSY